MTPQQKAALLHYWHRSNESDGLHEGAARAMDIHVWTSKSLHHHKWIAAGERFSWISFITDEGCLALGMDAPRKCADCGHFYGLHNSCEGGCCFGNDGQCSCTKTRSALAGGK